MFGGKKTFSSIDVVSTVLKSGQYADRSGAIVVSKKDGRKTVNTGILYVRNNKIYAAEVENTKLAMGTRVMTSGEIRRSDFDEMRRHFGGDLNHPGILSYLLENQLITDQQALDLNKEYFLAYVEDILAWSNVVGTWQGGTEYAYPTINTYVTLDDLQTILKKRKKLYQDFFELSSRYFRPQDLPSLVFRTKKRLPENAKPEAQQIYVLCQNDGSNIPSATHVTGMSHHAVFKVLLGFWKAGVVDITLRDTKLTYAYAMRLQSLGIGEEEPNPADYDDVEYGPDGDILDTEGEDGAFTDTPRVHKDENRQVFTPKPVSQSSDVALLGGSVLEGDLVLEGNAESTTETFVRHETPPATPPVRPEPVVEPVVNPDSRAIAALPEPDPVVEPEPVADPVPQFAELEAPAVVDEEDRVEDGQEEFLPSDSPVFRIHQKLEALTVERDAALEKLETVTAERVEQERGIALIADRLRRLTDQLAEEQDELRNIVRREDAQKTVCDNLNYEIEETINSFQFGQ